MLGLQICAATPVQKVLGMEPRALGMLGKCLKATSPARSDILVAQVNLGTLIEIIYSVRRLKV